MLFKAINRSWQQLLHPKFRSVFLTAIGAAVATLVVLTLALDIYWPESYSFGWDWLDEFGEWISSAGFWSIVIVVSYLLFPGVVTMVMGLMADKISSAVEEEYYPNRIGKRKVSTAETIFSAAKLTLVMVMINLLALIPYLLLFIATGGVGTLGLFLAVNGYLLGREYYEMVTARHLIPFDMNRMRITYSGKIFVGGAVIAGMFLIPFINILAPIVGAAMMTHIVHLLDIPSTARKEQAA